MDDDAGNPATLDAADAGPGHSTQADLCVALKSGLEHVLQIMEVLQPETVADLRDDSEYQDMLRRLWQSKTLAPPSRPTQSRSTVAANNRVGSRIYPATSSLQNEQKRILSSFPRISNSPQRSQAINEPVDVGFQKLAVKDSVPPHSAERSSDGILTIHFLTGRPVVNAVQASNEINRIVDARKALGGCWTKNLTAGIPDTLTLTCDSKDSGNAIATLIQRGRCKHLWSRDAEIFVRKGESKGYILTLSVVNDLASPRGRKFCGPWKELLPTLQQNLSSFVGDVRLGALSRPGSSSSPWYALCKGDPERLEGFLGPLNGCYVTRLGFTVRPKNSLMDKYIVTIKVLCLSSQLASQ